jgi:cytochrome c oxidase subunit I
MSEALGKVHFWLLILGFNLTFFPQFQLGIDGMQRRVADFPDAFTTGNALSTIGAFVIAASVAVFVVNFLRTVRKGDPAGDDPWGGNTLEWATSSPPPHHNFRSLPPIRSERPVFDARHSSEVERA